MKKKAIKNTFLLSFALTACLLTMSSCESKQGSADGTTARADALRMDTAMLSRAYAQFMESSIQHRRFKHHELESLVLNHQQAAVLDVQVLGQSVLGKNIYRLDYGSGPKKVMLWSQMHGNEATATMALLDLFNFLKGDNDEFAEVRQLLKEHTTLHFIPMLNPDGSDMFIRRNAMGIDLNRDARMAGTVEGKLLKDVAQRIKPDFGFNLHDQNIYNNIPGTPTPVTIALLAPAYNPEREINDVRERAIKLASGMDKILQQEVPGAVARYDDTYTPRGFGDNFQSWGASTVLIEAGGYKGDPEKLALRRLNFMIILNALVEIAQGTYEEHSVDQYNNLPQNSPNLTDLLLRGIKVKQDSMEFVTDISIRRSEVNQNRDYYTRSSIDDLGDLLDMFGYDEVGSKDRSSSGTADPAMLEIHPGTTFPGSIRNLEELTDEKVLDMLRKGYTAVRIAVAPKNLIHSWPLNIFIGSEGPKPSKVRLGAESTFMLKDASGWRYAVVNGYLIDLKKDLTEQYGPVGQRPIKNLIR